MSRTLGDFPRSNMVVLFVVDWRFQVFLSIVLAVILTTT